MEICYGKIKLKGETNLKKRTWMLSLLSSVLLLTSCTNKWVQQDWHINTLELADEYFPKYFDEIEEILQKNDVMYKKEYTEKVDPYTKFYMAKYYVTESLFYEVTLFYDCSFNCRSTADSNILFGLIYTLATEEEAFNIPQNYMNIIIDVTDFCCNNFLGTGEKINTLYDEAKAKYTNGEHLNVKDEKYVFVEERMWEETPPDRWIEVRFKDNEYNVMIGVDDYLTDVNIWDK